MQKLYHYVHCPFCVRVRLALGFFNIPYQSVVVPYDDEETPTKMCGVKMLPIFEFSPGEWNNESLEIIKRLDQKNQLSCDKLASKEAKDLDDLLSEIGASVHNLCMPYWIWTAEFSPSAREYFQKKKELKRGPFFKLIQNKEEYLQQLSQTLMKVESSLVPYYQSDKFSLFDIMLASHLWGMYIFPEFQFSEKLHNYLQNIKKICKFDYHHDFWNGPTPPALT